MEATAQLLLCISQVNIDCCSLYCYPICIYYGWATLYCARRLLVHKDPQGEKFVKRLIEIASRLDIGTYTDHPEPFIGPVISNSAADKVLGAYQNWLKLGAQELLPIKRLINNLPFLSQQLLM